MTEDEAKLKWCPYTDNDTCCAADEIEQLHLDVAIKDALIDGLDKRNAHLADAMKIVKAAADHLDKSGALPGWGMAREMLHKAIAMTEGRE